MAALFNVDWRESFVPTVPLAEIILRGSLVYLGVFSLLRFTLKRETGSMGVTDMLMIVLIADAAQNAMASNYRSIPEGLVLVATIIFWNLALDWLGYRFPLIHRFISPPPPLTLVKDGHMLRHNMRRELIREDELMSQLRLQGIDDIAEVKEAHVESDGRISVVARDSSKGGTAGRHRKGRQ